MEFLQLFVPNRHVSSVDLASNTVGALIGVPIALKLPMTAVPQRTAMSHAFGSFAVALIGMAEYFQRLPHAEDALNGFTTGVLAEYWLYLLGAAFIAVTLFLPRGIVGTLADALSRKPRAPASSSSELTTAAREDLPPATSNPQAAE